MTTGWGTYAKSSDGVFVNKDEWARLGIVFYITAIDTREATGNFKAEWQLTVTAEEAEETILTFSQSSGGRDDAVMAADKDLRAGTVTEIGPMILKKITTKRGNPFYALWDAPQIDEDAAPAATPAPVTVGEMP